MALIAGFQAPFDTVMGHAGAFARVTREHANKRFMALREAGVILTNHPSKFGNMMKQMLEELNPVEGHEPAVEDHVKVMARTKVGVQPNQKRGIHTLLTRPKLPTAHVATTAKRFGHFLSLDQSLELLKAHKIPVWPIITYKEKSDIVVRIDIHRQPGYLRAIISPPQLRGNNLRLQTLRKGAFPPLEKLLGPFRETTGPNKRRRVPLSYYCQNFLPLAHGVEKPSNDPTGHLGKLIQTFIEEDAFFLYARFMEVIDVEGIVYQLTEAQVGIDAPVYQGPKDPTDGFLRQFPEDAALTLKGKAAKDGIVFVKSVLQKFSPCLD